MHRAISLCTFDLLALYYNGALTSLAELVLGVPALCANGASLLPEPGQHPSRGPLPAVRYLSSETLQPRLEAPETLRETTETRFQDGLAFEVTARPGVAAGRLYPLGRAPPPS